MKLRLLEQLSLHARTRGDALAYTETATGRTLTWNNLFERACGFAVRLKDGCAPKSVILLCCPNTIEFPIAFLGILGAGCDVFPVSSEITGAELQTAAKNSNAVGLVAIDRTLSSLKFNLDARELFEGKCDFASGDLLLQSSGTTGLPKIVRRTARSLDSVSTNMVKSIGFSESDRALAAVPLCHSYGLEHGLLAPVFAGSNVQLCDGFDLATVTSALKSCTIFPGVPSMFEMLANVGDAKLDHLRIAYSAGGALPRNVFDAFKQKHNVTVGQLYGTTEIGSITFSNPRSPYFDPASVGQPMDGVEIHVLGDGQVAIKAPSMFDGYVDSSDSTLIDGFFPTGDLGRVDAHGNLSITGRLKLLIDVGGLKVNPLEVEELIAQHPSVEQCVVVAMKLSETVNRLKAIVIPRNAGDPPNAEALRQFVRARLTAFKVPRVFEIRDHLPKSPTGKILRHLVEAT